MKAGRLRVDVRGEDVETWTGVAREFGWAVVYAAVFWFTGSAALALAEWFATLFQRG